MRAARVLGALALAALVLTSSYELAGAVSSLHGDDLSYDYNSRHNIKACDRESDSNKVKAGWSVYDDGGETDSVTDGDGNNGVCASASTPGIIKKHHTCERNVFSWDCGNWKTTA